MNMAKIKDPILDKRTFVRASNSSLEIFDIGAKR